MSNVWNAIFLGNSGIQIDPTEGNARSENASLLVGQTFGSDSDRLASHVVEVTAIDNGGLGSNALSTNQFDASEELKFDLGEGAGVETTIFDGIAVYNATLTYTDGTTDTITAVVIQDKNGNLFLDPEISANSDSAAMEAKAIRSLSLDSLLNNNANMAGNRLQTNFVCYVAGTRILTPRGERRVETLQAGDLVITADRGPQPIRWIRSSRVLAEGKRAPIRIRAGALGRGLPLRDLWVSRQHRMVIASKIVERMFGVKEVLIPAIRLVGLPGIELTARGPSVTYRHMLMTRHEIVFAEGAPSESLLPGPFALEAMGEDARRDILRRIPDIATRDPRADAARSIPENVQQKMLVERHRRNAKPVLDTWRDPIKIPA